MTTSFYEGDSVSYTGSEMPPAQGRLLYFASDESAHVKWVTGAHAGQIDQVDIYDLAPVMSAQAIAQLDPMGHTAMRRVMDSEGPAGVLNFLVTAKQTEGWQKIAADVLAYVERRLRVDASMEMAYEQLRMDEIDRVVSLSSRALLRDAFSELDETG